MMVGQVSKLSSFPFNKTSPFPRSQITPAEVVMTVVAQVDGVPVGSRSRRTMVGHVKRLILLPFKRKSPLPKSQSVPAEVVMTVVGQVWRGTTGEAVTKVRGRRKVASVMASMLMIVEVAG